MDLQVAGKHEVACEIGDQRETCGGDQRRHDCQPVKAVGQVDGVAGADQHQDRPRNEEPPERQEDVLEERHRETGRERRRGQLHDPERAGAADGDERKQFRPPAQPVARVPGQLEIVVGEADGTESERDEEHRPHIGVGEIGPQERRDAGREQDQHAAHGRRALLGDQMARRAVRPDRLALALVAPEAPDDGRAEDEADEQRRHDGAARPQGDVAEQVERPELVGQRKQQVIEHGPMPPSAGPHPHPAARLFRERRRRCATGRRRWRP